MDSELLLRLVVHPLLTGDVLIRRDSPSFLRDYTADPQSMDRLGPQDYLRTARRDLEAGDVGGWVNALGNAKRAIDSQAERFAHCLGLPPLRPRPGARQCGPFYARRARQVQMGGARPAAFDRRAQRGAHPSRSPLP
ncbi:MAG: hypothetical protein ACUVX9_14985 [Anaerolineae bacterium]